jgi:hypothetical protein
MVEQTILSTALSVIAGAGSAAIYSLLWYARKKRKSDEPFNRFKFAGTIIVGAFVGGGFALSGTPITAETISAVLTANVGIISLLEPVLKIIFNETGIFENYSG